MGLYRKRDYTEGECFVVNAHFNPLGIDDEETLLKTKSSTATSEITLSLNSCQSGDRVGFADDKYPLKVVLPPETGGGGGGLGVESHLKGGSQWETTPNYVNSQNEDKTTKNNHRMKNINGIQGFECDVSVEADFSGKQKREFVFTLYDLDGDGQITKDDITGLVRSMYEALGTSLKLPPSGSRTIRVRLTMSPGKKSGEKKKSSGECPTYQDKYNSVDKEIKRAASEVEKSKNEEDQQQPPPPQQQQEAASEQDNENGDEEDEEEGETEEEDVKTPVQKHYLLSHCMRKMPHRSKRREMTTALTRPSVHRSKTHRSAQGHRSASPCGRRRTRVSFSKEQQLLEIIQSNLEKKGCGQCQGQNQRKRSSNVEGTPRQYHVRRMRSDCFRCECVVDSCHDNGRACPYQNVNTTTTNGYPPKGETGFQYPKTRAHHHQHHTRSHSHDLTDYYQQQQQMVEDNLNHLRVEDILLKDVRTVHEKMDWFGQFINQKKNPGVQPQQHHTRSKSYDPQQCCKVACNLMTFTPTCKFRLDSGFGYLSSHHHKHRHREEDHQRAMEQVACWIEKEHSGLRGSCIPPSDHHHQQQPQPHTHHHHSHPEDNGEADVKKSSPVPVVERHEHHHIHQHYHHHYHHYHQL